MIAYPKLMKSDNYRIIALFPSSGTGIVVSTLNGSNIALGTEIHIGDMGDFRDYFGIVRLQNNILSLRELVEAEA